MEHADETDQVAHIHIYGDISVMSGYRMQCMHVIYEMSPNNGAMGAAAAIMNYDSHDQYVPKGSHACANDVDLCVRIHVGYGR